MPIELYELIDKGITKEDARKFLKLEYLATTFKNYPKEPTRWVSVEKERFKFNGNGCLLILCIPTLLFIGAMTVGGFQGNSPQISLLFIIILFVVLAQLGVKLKSEKYYVSEKLSDYEFNSRMKEYEKILEDVKLHNLLQKNNYDREKIRIDSIVEQKFQDASEKLLCYHLSPLFGIRKIPWKQYRGRCEVNFLGHLYKRFGNQILVDCVPDEGQNPYQPDFLFISEKTGLMIDIEIDEPYTADNKVPTHHNRSNDNERNFFFEDNNCVVVRFSEKQIATEPENCCNLLHNLIEYIELRSNKFEFSLTLDKVWTYEEALIMASNDYRNSYLPHNLKLTNLQNRIKPDDKSDYLPF